MPPSPATSSRKSRPTRPEATSPCTVRADGVTGRPLRRRSCGAPTRDPAGWSRAAGSRRGPAATARGARRRGAGPRTTQVPVGRSRPGSRRPGTSRPPRARAGPGRPGRARGQLDLPAPTEACSRESSSTSAYSARASSATSASRAPAPPLGLLLEVLEEVEQPLLPGHGCTLPQPAARAVDRATAAVDCRCNVSLNIVKRCQTTAYCRSRRHHSCSSWASPWRAPRSPRRCPGRGVIHVLGRCRPRRAVHARATGRGAPVPQRARAARPWRRSPVAAVAHVVCLQTELRLGRDSRCTGSRSGPGSCGPWSAVAVGSAVVSTPPRRARRTAVRRAGAARRLDGLHAPRPCVRRRPHAPGAGR